MVLLGMVPVLMQTPPTAALLFDDGDAFAGLRALDGGALTSGPGTDDDQIIAEH